MAESDPTTPYTPPGNRALVSVATEYGVDRVRSWLTGRGWRAPPIDVFAFNPKTGREYVVADVALWNSEHAVEVIRVGKLGDLVLFVRDFGRWPPDHVFDLPDERDFPLRRDPEPVEPEPAPEKVEDKPAAAPEDVKDKPTTPVESEPEPAKLREPGEPDEPPTSDPQILEAEPLTRHPGGKEPVHDWESAARYVDGKVDDKIEGRKPLPRNKHGEPIVQRAMDLMKDYFKHDPPSPEDRSIRRWIKENPERTRGWWDVE